MANWKCWQAKILCGSLSPLNLQLRKFYLLKIHMMELGNTAFIASLFDFILYIKLHQIIEENILILQIKCRST